MNAQHLNPHLEVNQPGVTIERLDAAQTAEALPELVCLFQDAVASGASIGFLPPLSTEEAEHYWQKVLAEVRGATRVLLVARRADELAGSVQLDLAQQRNAAHRAEVQKLMVHRASRRQGLGRALMQAAESVAHALGRTLLVLDTRQGDPAEQLYRSLGYVRAGEIPNYARSADGSLHTTIIFYRELSG
jgi:ribosomal protein S18 acetylase RimI-like enzyme